MRKMITTLALTAALLAGVSAHAGDSAPFRLDTVLPPADLIPISWDASWIGGNANAIVVIHDNGTEVKRDTGTGTFTHTLSGGGRHELTYTTYIGSVAQAEVYTAMVYEPYCIVAAMDGKTMRQLYPTDYARITTVVFEEGITDLPVGFFDGCANVVSVTWPSTLVEFCIDAVPPKIQASLAYDESGFKIYNGWILDYQNRDAMEVVIPEGIVGIGRGAFAEMYDLEAVTMPESLRCIASGAFEGCTWIQEFQFMSGLRYVGPMAFRDCSSLLRAAFADGVENIGTNAFEGCWHMQSVRLPSSVTNIGANAFSGCGNIRGVTVPTQIKTMQQLFPAAYSLIETAEVAEGETVVMDDMFAGCEALRGGATQTDMSMIPSTVTNIGARAFQNCTSLTSFVLPDSVLEIGESAFSGCSSLWNVTLSRNLTALPDYAFYSCSALETMIVPESVTYIGNRFFSGRTASGTGNAAANALYYLGNAPGYDPSAYAAISGNMTTYVVQGSRSWDGRQGSRVLPQSWNGYPITYWTPNRFDVTFDANGGRFELADGAAYTWSEQQITDMGYALPSTEPVRPGWAFEGWWTEQTGGAQVRYTTIVTATRPHTLYAHWRSLGERMTVAFNSNGGTEVVPGTQDYVPGQTFEQFPVPTRRGYTFNGWWTESANGVRITEATQVPAADMELFAHWQPITYFVRFHANGGAGTMADRSFTYDVQGTLATHSFTRAGFAFSGWATTPSGVVRYAENASVVNLEEVQGEIVHLYAVWAGAGYAVRFDANGGTGEMCNQTIAVGETQNLWPCAFVRGGHVFGGWALSPTDAANGVVTYRDEAAVTDLAASNGATIPLYAVWVSSDQMVHVTFNANGGSVQYAEYTTAGGLAVGELPVPVRTGHTFMGWFTAAEGGVQISESTVVTGDVTYYAHWTVNQYTATFNANGGTGGQNVTQDYGTSITAPTVTRTGYTFTGWEPSVPLKMPDEDRTYTAQWQVNQYTATFNANGGTGGKSVTQDYGTTLSAPTVTRTGYVLTGWSPSVPSTMPAESRTYTAQWKPRQYTVTFNANGGTGGTSGKQDYGSSIIAPTVTRTGYTFAGWWPSVAATVPANDVTYTAQWTVNQYTATFNANGGTGGKSVTQNYGTTLSAPTVTRTGYALTGWSPSVPSTMPAESRTYTAQWKPRQYTVTFNANGGTGGTSGKQDYGSSIVAPTVTRTGYTFAGWSPSVAATVPANDVTYTAQWTANSYSIAYDPNGGSGTMDATPMVYDVAGVLAASDFTYAEHLFIGWATEPEGSVAYSAGQSVTNLTAQSGGVVMLYACWTSSTCSWTGAAGDRKFSTAGNWDSGVVPPAGADVRIEVQEPLTLICDVDVKLNTVVVPESSAVVTIGMGDLHVQSLKNAYKLAIAKGASLTIDGDLVGYAANNNRPMLYSNEGRVTVGGLVRFRSSGPKRQPDSNICQYQVTSANTTPIIANGLAYHTDSWSDYLVPNLGSINGGKGLWVIGSAGTSYPVSRQISHSGFWVRGGQNATLYSSADWTLAETYRHMGNDLRITDTARITLDTTDWNDKTTPRTVTFKGFLYANSSAETPFTVKGCGTLVLDNNVVNGKTNFINRTFAVRDMATLQIKPGKSIYGSGTVSLATGTTLALPAAGSSPIDLAVALDVSEGVGEKAFIRIGGADDIVPAGTYTILTAARLPDVSRLALANIKAGASEFSASADGKTLILTVAEQEEGEIVDLGGGKTLVVPNAWLAEKTALLATDVAANGRKVWECYVLGLDPESVLSDLRITEFPMDEDGTPDLKNLSFEPAQSEWNLPGARPVIKGASTLAGEWLIVTEENKSQFRYFKVEVVLP